MNHSQLRAFHAVAKAGSFTKASAALRVSQPTLSGHVKALEDGYGTQLFQRGGRSVSLTEFGNALFAITQRYFATEVEAQQLLASAKGLAKGTLRIGADSPHFIMPLLGAFSRRFPKVEQVVFFGNSQAVLSNILSSKSDIAILPDMAPDNRLLTIPFKRDNLVVIVDQGHPWSVRREIRLEDVADECLILREVGSTTRAVFEAALAERAVVPKSVIEMGSREAQREAVAAGLGISFVNEGEFGHDTRLHKLQISDIELNVMEFFVCRRDFGDNAVVAAFLDLVREMATP